MIPSISLALSLFSAVFSPDSKLIGFSLQLLYSDDDKHLDQSSDKTVIDFMLSVLVV